MKYIDKYIIFDKIYIEQGFRQMPHEGGRRHAVL